MRKHSAHSLSQSQTNSYKVLSCNELPCFPVSVFSPRRCSSPKRCPTCYRREATLQFVFNAKGRRASAEFPQCVLTSEVKRAACVALRATTRRSWSILCSKQKSSAALSQRPPSTFACVLSLACSSLARCRGFKALRLQTERSKVGYELSLGRMTLYSRASRIVAVPQHLSVLTRSQACVIASQSLQKHNTQHVPVRRMRNDTGGAFGAAPLHSCFGM